MNIKIISLLIMIFSCSKEEDFIPETETPIIIPELEVNDFIYNSMNE